MVRGGQLTSRTIAFSDDGKYLLVPAASTTRLYSTATAQFVSQIRGHISTVTNVTAGPKGTSQVLTSSADGCVKRWTIPQGELLSSSTVSYPIEHMVLLPHDDVVLLSLHHREGQAGRVVRFSLKSGQILPGSVLKTLLPGPPLVPSPSGSYVGTFEKRVMTVWRASADHIKAAPFFHTKDFQCMCIDPEDKILAAGDVSGRILIWHNFGTYVDAKAAGKELEPPQCSTLHWHAQAVGCMTFTADSTYLLSGGKEGVLVIWHLATGERNYLPRLGSGLKNIVVCPTDPSLYCLAQEDNTIRLFNLSSMQVVRSIHGVRPPPRGVNALELNACTKMHPVSRYLVMSGANSSLQFFDPLQDRHVSKLQVVPRNHILTDWHKLGHTPMDPRVSHVSFSADGTVMVTIDVRPDASGRASALEGMRFWDEANGGVHTNQAAPYTLNTYMDQPHSEGTTSMSYHPLEDTVVTTGRQHGFKVWHRPAAARTSSSSKQTQKCWNCSCVGSYRRLPFFSSTFSSDGSILALGSSAAVVLWEYPTVTWLATLTCPGTVNRNSFFYSVTMPGNGLFVVGASQGCDDPKVVVWNVETLMPVWVLSLYTCGLSSHPTLDVFAVAIPARQKPDQDNSLPLSMVLVFEATSSRPKRVVRVPDCLFPWVAFASPYGLLSREDSETSCSTNPGPLVILSERRSIYWAVGTGQRLLELNSAPTHTDLAEAPTSKLAALFGDPSVSATPDTDEIMDGAANNTRSQLDRVAKLLDMPSHLLPPASTLCARALELLLLPQIDGDE